MKRSSLTQRVVDASEPFRGLGLRSIAKVSNKLFGAAVAGQLLALLAAPVLLRQYEPEAFGVYLAMTVITSVGISIATMRFEIAIQSPKSFRKAIALAMVAAYATVLTALLTSFFYYLFSDFLGQVFKIESVRSYFYYVPIMLLTVPATEILRILHWRKQAFGVTAQATLITAAITVGIQCALGTLDVGAHGLLIGACVGQSFTMLWLLSALRRYNIPRTSVSTFAIQTAAAFEYRDFALYTMPAGLLHTLSTQAAPFSIAAVYGPTVGGFYYLAARLVSAPVNILSSAIYPAFINAATNFFYTDRLRLIRLYCGFVIGLLLVMSPLLLLFPRGEWLFAVAFGQKWSDAGAYAAWISIGSTFQLAAMSTSCLNPLRFNKLHAYWVLLHTLLIGMVLGAVFFAEVPTMSAVAALGVANALSYTTLIAVTLAALFGASNSLDTQKTTYLTVGITDTNLNGIPK